MPLRIPFRKAQLLFPSGAATRSAPSRRRRSAAWISTRPRPTPRAASRPSSSARRGTSARSATSRSGTRASRSRTTSWAHTSWTERGKTPEVMHVRKMLAYNVYFCFSYKTLTKKDVDYTCNGGSNGKPPARKTWRRTVSNPRKPRQIQEDDSQDEADLVKVVDGKERPSVPPPMPLEE